MAKQVELTWDSTDPRREEKILHTKFSTDALRMSDFKAYLASSESDTSEDEWEEILEENKDGACSPLRLSSLTSFRRSKGKENEKKEASEVCQLTRGPV